MKKQEESVAYFLWLLIGLMLLGTLVSQWMGAFVIKYFYGIQKIESLNVLGQSHPSAWYAIRWIQLLHTVLTFLIPAVWVWRKYFRQNENSNIKEGSSSIRSLLVVPFLLLSLLPLVMWSYELNQNIFKQTFIYEWLNNIELSNMEMFKGMLTDTSWQAISLNFFIIAILAAVSEELFFRGVFQSLLIKKINPHWAIIITGIFFSIIHFQFLGFLPRALLGIFFGYLFFHTGRLIVPIFAHFLFNGGQLLLYYFHKGDYFEIKPEHTDNVSVYIVVFSIIVFIFIYRISKSLIFPKKYGYLE